MEEAELVAKLILENKIILYPTDTIWGIGGNLEDINSFHRIGKLKKRDPAKAFILLVDSINMLHRYTIRIHPRIETMLHYNTKPITIIYPKTKNIPNYLLAEDQSVAIRICSEPFCKEVIRLIDRPLISTSANYSGDPSPENFEAIDKRILSEVDYVVRYRQNDKTKSQPSVLASYNESGELDFIR